MSTSRVLPIGILILFAASVCAQAGRDIPPRVTYFELRDQLTVNAPAGIGIVLPIKCGEDGSFFLRFTSPGGIGDVTRIFDAGKRATLYRRADIEGFSGATPTSFFVTNSGVFLLADAVKEAKSETRESTLSSGKKITQDVFVGDSQQIVARFSLTGEFIDKTVLDIPFRASQVGVFSSGDLVISGMDQRSGKIYVAVASANGKFNRFIELQKDITDDSPPDVDEASRQRNRNALIRTVGTTELIGFRDSILLFRHDPKIPVFEINVNGEVTPHSIAAPEDFFPTSLTIARNSWIFRWARRQSGGGLQFDTALVDADTGSTLERYMFSGLVGGGPPCMENGQPVFLKYAASGSLLLVRAAPR